MMRRFPCLIVFSLVVMACEVQAQTSRAGSAASYTYRGNDWLAKGELDLAIDDYNKAQLMDAWKSGRVKYTSASDKDLSVRVYGDTAVTTGILTLKGQNPRGDFTVNARYTRVWMKQQVRRRLVATQLTDIPQQQSQ